jgi:uncharacterized protein YllA (UPF0747 family)
MLRSEPRVADAPEGPVPDLAAAGSGRGFEATVEAVVAYQAGIDAPPQARAAAESLADPDAAVIVAGQQPGLLGGPLLTVAKALTAVAGADRMTAESGRPVTAVFWAATEDHDVDEVNRLDVLTADDEPRRFSLPLTPDGRMLSEIDPGPEADDMLREVAAVLPGVDHRIAIGEMLTETRVPSIGGWFTRILSRWLGGMGLVVVEPRILREAAATVVALEHDRPGAIVGKLAEGPVTPAPIPFFNVVDGRRVRPQDRADLSKDPTAISWDVMSRVLAQNTAFPVAGQVVGPAERLYCAQVAPAHELLGLRAPPLLPRASLTLVEKKVERALGRFGTTAAAVLARGEEALRENEPKEGDFHRALTEVEEALQSAFPGVRDEAGRLDDTLARKAAGSEKEIMRALTRLRDHGRKALERVTGQDAVKRAKVLAHLLPGGAGQDRSLSPLPFLARHGTKLLDRLAEVVRRYPDGDRIVYLSGKES